MDALVDVLERIADSLERIEKALPSCNQEALSKLVEQKVTWMLQSAASSAHTLEAYK